MVKDNILLTWSQKIILPDKFLEGCMEFHGIHQNSSTTLKLI